MALNLLTDDPTQPSGAHWCWTRIVPEMANRLLPGEELNLMLSPSARHYFPDDGDAVRCLTFPWSNEHRLLRTASEHLVTPFRLPLRHIDLLSTAIAPVVKSTRSLVIHMKTMHAFTVPETVGIGPRMYRRLNYQRSVRIADAVIVNSNSLRAEIDQYLEVDPAKVSLIYEAVDHDIFKPGDRDAARAHVAPFGISRPFVLFVSSLWRYKNADGLLHAWKLIRHELAGRQLVILGAERDQKYSAELHQLVADLGIADDVVFAGGVPNEETVHFYRAADLLAYPSFNETFGLADPGGDGVRLSGRHIQCQLHARDCRWGRHSHRPARSERNRPIDPRSRRFRRSPDFEPRGSVGPSSSPGVRSPRRL